MKPEELENLVVEIHTAIVGSIDGSCKGFHERISILETFKKNFEKWTRFLIGGIFTNIGLFVIQLLVFYFTVVKK